MPYRVRRVCDRFTNEADMGLFFCACYAILPVEVKTSKQTYYGSVPERLMGADCKSAGFAYAGSNPARPNINKRRIVF